MFHVIGTAEGLAIPAVSTVCEDGDSNIWIGTFGGGLNRWRDGTLTRFDLSEGAYNGNFFSAYPDTQGRLWLSAGREDLFVLETNKFSQPYRAGWFMAPKSFWWIIKGWCGLADRTD